MNPTVMRLTLRTLLGRKRFVLLVALPGLLLAVTVLLRLLIGSRDEVAWALAAGFGLSTMVPLVSLLAGTGALGPEIDDGSIAYLLSKPISRHVIVLSKLVVAVGVSLVLGAVPVVLAGALTARSPGMLTPAMALAAAVAVAAYCALFLLLSVLTRNAVMIGLLYAVVWETTVANIIPGAKALSVRQWSLALAQWAMGPDAARQVGVDAAVGPVAGLVALVLVCAGAAGYAGWRLRSVGLAMTE